MPEQGIRLLYYSPGMDAVTGSWSDPLSTQIYDECDLPLNPGSKRLASIP